MYQNQIMGKVLFYFKKIILSLAVIAALGGCNLNDSDPLNENPFIRGHVTDFKEGKAYNSILVEENPNVSEPTEPDGTKIWLLLVDDTEIFIREGDGSLDKSNARALAIGQRAESWVSGPVDDTYPLQGAASQIVIIQE